MTDPPASIRRAVTAARPAGALALAGGLALLLGLSPFDGGTAAPPVAAAAGAMVDTASLTDPEVAAFYRSRDGRPLWTDAGRLRPEALELLGIVSAASRDALEPSSYYSDRLRAAVERARKGERGAALEAEPLLSRAFADYVRDLRASAAADTFLFVDRELAPTGRSPRLLLEAAAAAPSLAVHLEGIRRMNPLYEQLRDAAGRGFAPPALIAANLDRLRLLPADGRRHIVVDAAGARLWMIEGGRIVDSMRVVVGKAGMETPQMAALIRFQVLNPYWNIPPDLVRDKIAPRVLARGDDYLALERLEALSGWEPGARILDPAEVDWAAIAAGAQRLRMRQLPGRDNMMGAVKFILPNRLGIYLHDTPDKAAFRRADRRLSSGCVRVEDAPRLARWLFGGEAPAPAGAAAEHRIDLPRPVPVYITYLTAVASGDGVEVQRDVYGRDPQLMARLQSRGRLS